MHARISPQIEHRLFSQITLGWRGRPLTSYDVVINTISAVTTSTGLTVTAMLDPALWPTGTQISDKQMKDLEDRLLTRREQDRYLRHGRPRQKTPGAGGSNRKLDLTDHVLAVRLRQHLDLPATVIGALLGADRTTVTHATALAGSLLARLPQPPAGRPPGIRLRTLASLRDYTASHSITIPDLTEPGNPPHDTLTTRATPQTHLNLE